MRFDGKIIRTTLKEAQVHKAPLLLAAVSLVPPLLLERLLLLLELLQQAHLPLEHLLQPLLRLGL